MATGDPVGQILRVMPVTAYPVAIVGTSTPAERIMAYEFPNASDTHLDLMVALQGYDGGGLTVRLVWSSSVNTNNCVWQAAFRRIEDDAEDLDTSAHTYDYNTVTGAAPSAVGEASYDNITFTNGADMDSLANGEAAILRIRRDPANASDTMAGEARLLAVFVYET